MDAHTVDFTIANGGTTADIALPPGQRLVGLQFPTLTSTTVAPSLSKDGTTFVAAHDATGAAYTIGGSAFTAARIIPVPEELSRLAMAFSKIRLTFASQGAERSCKAIFASAGAQ